MLSQADWGGPRSEGNVAKEIRAHCLAWLWLPPLRGPANPVDLEFFQGWPLNLIVSIKARVGKLIS